MAHNLGVILRKLIGVGKPREWASMRAFLATCVGLWSTILAWLVAAGRQVAAAARDFADRTLATPRHITTSPEAASSTGC